MGKDKKIKKQNAHAHHPQQSLSAFQTGLIGGLAGGLAGALAGVGANYGYQSYQQHHQPQFNTGYNNYAQMGYAQNTTGFPQFGTTVFPTSYDPNTEIKFP